MTPPQKPGRSRQDYETPAAFMAAVRAMLGIDHFDIDLAAAPENAKAVTWITSEQDALTVPWAARAAAVGRSPAFAWVNPPFAWKARDSASCRGGRFPEEAGVPWGWRRPLGNRDPNVTPPPSCRSRLSVAPAPILALRDSVEAGLWADYVAEAQRTYLGLPPWTPTGSRRFDPRPGTRNDRAESGSMKDHDSESSAAGRE